MDSVNVDRHFIRMCPFKGDASADYGRTRKQRCR